MRTSIAVGASALALITGLAACGDEQVSYSDKEIVDQLNLEKSGDGYAIDGDPFCEVEAKLLNDAAEVEAARGGRNGELVISSREGNAGVKATPGFAPDCQEFARKKLNKLDPPPAD